MVSEHEIRHSCEGYGECATCGMSTWMHRNHTIKERGVFVDANKPMPDTITFGGTQYMRADVLTENYRPWWVVALEDGGGWVKSYRGDAVEILVPREE